MLKTDPYSRITAALDELADAFGEISKAAKEADAAGPAELKTEPPVELDPEPEAKPSTRKAASKKATSKKAATQKPEAKPEAKPATEDEVRAALVLVMEEFSADDAVEILEEEAGVDKVSDLKAEDYQKVIAACEAALAEE